MFFLMFGLVVLGTACGSGASSEGGDEAAEGEGTMVEETVVTTTGEGYQITVLNADIPSPRKEMKTTIGGVNVVVNYGSPSVKEREIWGALVPYDKVWRMGANEATTIEFSGDVTINGQELPAGKYGLFTIPGQGEWIVVFNQVSEMWGSNDYDEAKDVLRVTVTPQQAAELAEAMDFVVEGDAVVLRWESLSVPFTVAAKN